MAGSGHRRDGGRPVSGVSWLGLWLWLPPLGRAIGLGLFFLLTAAAFAPFLHAAHADPHRRPAAARPQYPAAAPAGDCARRRPRGRQHRFSVSVALWRAHIERTLRAARTLKAGLPTPRLAARDPFALRGLVLFLVLATFFAAGGERMKRIAAAFDWQGVMLPANFRLDAWVSPPPYTGKPPVILQGLRPGEPVQQSAAALSVPAGQHAGDPRERPGAARCVEPRAASRRPASRKGHAAAAKGTEEHRYVINDAGAVTVRGIVAERRDLEIHRHPGPRRPRSRSPRIRKRRAAAR